MKYHYLIELVGAEYPRIEGRIPARKGKMRNHKGKPRFLKSRIQKLIDYWVVVELDRELEVKSRARTFEVAEGRLLESSNEVAASVYGSFEPLD